MSISMKLIIGVVFITAIFVSSPLQAGDKDVVVTNDATSPIPVEIQNGAQTIVEWRYVGHTRDPDAKKTGDFEYGGLRGIAAMNKACADEYPGARAATISEGLQMDSPAEFEAFSWLVPGGSMTAVLAPNDYEAHDAATGPQVGIAKLTAAEALVVAYCHRYTNGQSDKVAPILASVGEILLGACSLDLPVACSAPVAIPVTPLP